MCRPRSRLAGSADRACRNTDQCAGPHPDPDPGRPIGGQRAEHPAEVGVQRDRQLDDLTDDSNQRAGPAG